MRLNCEKVITPPMPLICYDFVLTYYSFTIQLSNYNFIDNFVFENNF